MKRIFLILLSAAAVVSCSKGGGKSAGRPGAKTKGELIEFEKQLNIDQTPIMTKLSVDELKALIPKGYTYILDESKKHIKSKMQLSESYAKGRYKIMKGEELISEGYNDQAEDYFLCKSLLFILEKENLFPTNPQ